MLKWQTVGKHRRGVQRLLPLASVTQWLECQVFLFCFCFHNTQLTFCESNRKCFAEQTAGFPGSGGASLPSAEPSMLTGSQKKTSSCAGNNGSMVHFLDARQVILVG